MMLFSPRVPSLMEKAEWPPSLPPHRETRMFPELPWAVSQCWDGDITLVLFQMDAGRIGGEIKTCWRPKGKHLPTGKLWLRLANVCPDDERLPWKVFSVWFLTWPVLPVHSLHGMYVCVCSFVSVYLCVPVCSCVCMFAYVIAVCVCSYACLYVSLYVYVCLSVCLFICVRLCMRSLCLCIFFSVFFVYVCLFLPVCVHLCISVSKCVCASPVYVYLCLCVCLSVCLSVCLREWMLMHTGWWERRGIFTTLLWLLEGGCGISCVENI